MLSGQSINKPASNATIGIEACVVNACAGRHGGACRRLAVYSCPFRGHRLIGLSLSPFCIVVERAVCWPMCIRVTVAMYLVCASKQCTHETCIQNFMHDIVKSLGAVILQG